MPKKTSKWSNIHIKQTEKQIEPWDAANTVVRATEEADKAIESNVCHNRVICMQTSLRSHIGGA